MHIIILGAGKVGKTLTEYLSQEDHDIVIIDLNPKKVETVVEQCDVLGITGNGATYDILIEAGAKYADIIISVTASDELNILAGLMAKKMGTKNCIARVRNPDYLKQRSFMCDELGLSMIINPELEGANEIRRLLLFPSALKVDTFVSGRIELAEFKLREGTKLDGVSLHQLPTISKSNILICAVRRKHEIVIPDGDFILQKNDNIYVSGVHKDLNRFCLDIGLFKQKMKKVMIVGGGKIAFYLAQQLEEQGIRVKIIENNPERCLELSRKLPNATVIEADGSDEETLMEEGIENTDGFVALTGLDEENIVVCLYAKHMRVKKTIAKVTRLHFTGFVDSIDIDSIVSPKSLIASHIVRYVRAKNNKDDDSSVKTLHQIVNDRVEAVEFVVTRKTSFVGKKVSALLVKENLLIAAIAGAEGFLIPKGDTIIQEGNHIIVVTKDQKLQNIHDILRG